MLECEKLFEEKDKYEEITDAKDILKRLRLSQQIEILLNEIESSIKNLEKKYKKDNQVNEINLIKERHKFLKEEKFEKIHIKNNLLNSYLINSENKEPGSKDNLRSNNNSDEDRSLYDIEKEFIDEFKLGTIQIDKKVDELGRLVPKLKIAAEEIGKIIKGNNIQITKITPKAVKIIDEVKSKTEMVNDYIKEIRKPFNFCCDIILIIILLGLICVLISIIKHKFF